MRYYMTDFSTKETKNKIEYYESKGLFVYAVIDTGGIHYKICSKNSICNRFGFVITDTKLLNDLRDELTDEEFMALNGIEDVELSK